MSFTLATLKSAVQDYCETAESTFVSQLDTFIKEAEERILKNVTLPVFRKNVTGQASSGNPYLSTPSDFLASYSLALIVSGEYSYPLLKQASFIRAFTPNASTTGETRYYALFNESTFILSPTPAADYAFELHYQYRPASLTTTSGSDTTWLSDNAPDALLYGTLTEAATFLKVPEEVAQYEQRFSQAVASLKALGEGYGAQDQYRYDIARG
jgi:hypothetical protein|tara:strand:- start:273 stop:908 length:636 start_codon:yes stop_codon:yes gene_type:complete